MWLSLPLELVTLIAGTGAVACPTLNNLVFQNGDQHAKATGDPLILSEFGATVSARRITKPGR